MTEHDVLFGYRLQLFDLAAPTIASACRTFGFTGRRSIAGRRWWTRMGWTFATSFETMCVRWRSRLVNRDLWNGRSRTAFTRLGTC